MMSGAMLTVLKLAVWVAVISCVVADDDFDGSGEDVWLSNDYLIAETRNDSSSNSSSIITTSTISTNTSTPTIVPSTTTIPNTTTLAPLIIDKTNFEDDYVDNVGEVYEYEVKVVQLFQYINSNNNDDKEKIYLDTSNREIGPALRRASVVNSEYPHHFLNLLQYSLYRNTIWDDEGQIVLRNQQSQLYFCLSNCGVYYMSDILTLDCVFVEEVVQNIIEDRLEKICLRKRYNGNMVTVNVERAHINFKNYATLFSQEVDYLPDKLSKLTPVLDMAKADCTPKYKTHFIDETNHDYTNKEVQTAATINMSLYTLIICLTVIIVMLAGLATVTIVVKFKRRSFRLTNKV
uniref:ORF140 FGF-3 n=1 Tax=Cydia pomonella granulosis virus TaxID=28289 RepID=A0A097P1A4_GVCP|nr:ORF140 FGF-3 [Cydia pomonella granulovirus]